MVFQLVGVGRLQFPAALLTLPDGARLPLFLDTPRHWPLGQVPAQRAGSDAAIVHDDGVEPFVLPAAPFASQDVRVRGQATLRDNTNIQIAARGSAVLVTAPGFSISNVVSGTK